MCDNYFLQDPMDAYLGSYETGSDFEDDEWMIAELIEPIETFSNGSPNDNIDCEKKGIRPEIFEGRTEYKLKLINPTDLRFKQLVSQVHSTLPFFSFKMIY